jgi:hypothetical protein
MPNPNLELLELAAERLRQLLPEIVFVGGCATGLLIDDPAAAPVRGTYDVDVIAEIGSYAEYTVFSERLRGLGFIEDSREGTQAHILDPHAVFPSRRSPLPDIYPPFVILSRLTLYAFLAQRLLSDA